MQLSKEQKLHYSRHILLDEIGEEGQKKLLSSSVLVIGAGGLGSPAAMYLASAGVGTIGIADADTVDLSNLQRQILHTVNDLGVAKVQSAKATLEQINNDINVNTYNTFVSSENIMEIIKDYDIVLDCTDNFPAKFLINDACVMSDKPFVHAGVIRFQGQLMTCIPKKSPCYRCIFREPPPNDVAPVQSSIGIVGAAAGVIGSLHAMEAIKYITGAGELLTGKMLIYDALKAEFRKINLPKDNSDCPVCGSKPTITKLVDYEKNEYRG